MDSKSESAAESPRSKPSPEFDANAAGRSADQLREVALRGLRYLCFTHDTGPADCIRPTESWGRTEPAGTKWGERGRGFFLLSSMVDGLTAEASRDGEGIALIAVRHFEAGDGSGS